MKECIKIVESAFAGDVHNEGHEDAQVAKMGGRPVETLRFQFVERLALALACDRLAGKGGPL
jgi:hypothetical protein